MTEFLIDTYSWRTSFVILGIMTLGIILAGTLLLRSTPLKRWGYSRTVQRRRDFKERAG